MKKAQYIWILTTIALLTVDSLLDRKPGGCFVLNLTPTKVFNLNNYWMINITDGSSVSGTVQLGLPLEKTPSLADFGWLYTFESSGFSTFATVGTHPFWAGFLESTQFGPFLFKFGASSSVRPSVHTAENTFGWFHISFPHDHGGFWSSGDRGYAVVSIPAVGGVLYNGWLDVQLNGPRCPPTLNRLFIDPCPVSEPYGFKTPPFSADCSCLPSSCPHPSPPAYCSEPSPVVFASPANCPRHSRSPSPSVSPSPSASHSPSPSASPSNSPSHSPRIYSGPSFGGQNHHPPHGFGRSLQALEGAQRMVQLGETNPEELLPVFVHLPKAGGTTIMSIILKNLQEHGLEKGFAFFGNPPHLFELNEAMDRNRDELTFIAGHVALEQLEEIAGYLGRKFLPFTVLRDPRERFLSHWAWAQQYHKELTLEQFVNGTIPNTMFRMLTPLHADRNNIEATLTAIQEALNTHFIVGLTERFEESLVLFKRVGLLDSIDFNKHKVIHDRLRWNDLTEKQQQLVDSMIELDQRVYAIAKTIFEKTVGQQDDSFQQEVEEFKRHQASKPVVECEDDNPAYGNFRCDGSFQDKMGARLRTRDEAHKSILQNYGILIIAADRVLPKPRYY